MIKRWWDKYNMFCMAFCIVHDRHAPLAVGSGAVHGQHIIVPCKDGSGCIRADTAHACMNAADTVAVTSAPQPQRRPTKASRPHAAKPALQYKSESENDISSMSEDDGPAHGRTAASRPAMKNLGRYDCSMVLALWCAACMKYHPMDDNLQTTRRTTVTADDSFLLQHE